MNREGTKVVENPIEECNQRYLEASLLASPVMG